MTTTTLEYRSIEVNGIDLHYRDTGEGPPLLLLHGGLMSASDRWLGLPVSYAPFYAELGTRFRVVAPDSRGHGRTPKGGGQLSMSRLADDTAALVTALGLDSPVVAGFSNGGIVATILALRHPGLARGIVNDAGQDVFDPDSPTFPMTRAMFGGWPEATAPDLAAIDASFGSDPAMSAFLEIAKQDHAEGWAAHVQSFFELVHWPGYGFSDFAAIDVPALMLVGDRDHFVPVEYAAQGYRNLPLGQLAVVPGAGHEVNRAKIDALTTFAAELTG